LTGVNKPSDRVIILSQICEKKDFQIYLWKLTPLKIKQDFEEISVSSSAKVSSDEEGYIQTRCMFDVLLGSETAEKPQV